MNTLSYKTISANKETVNKNWVLVDAEGEILGRLQEIVFLVFTLWVACDNIRAVL